MQTTPFRALGLIGLVLLVMTSGAAGQFIRFSINLPPSFELNNRAEPPVVIEPADLPSGTVTGIKQGIRWMEIRANENVDLIIDMRYSRGRSSIRTQTLFLNDGTTNFIDAQQIPSIGAHVRMFNQDVVITQMKGSPKYISAWLGLTAGVGGVLTITYP
jgi:hypothetical protein